MCYICCCCCPCACCHKNVDRWHAQKESHRTEIKVLQANHRRGLSSVGEVFIGIGCQYAFFRQFIFLINSVMVGAGMSLLAAGIEQTHNSELITWIGEAYAIIICSFGGSFIVTNLLGCTGSCYESKCTLKLFGSILLILITGEITIVLLLFVTDMNKILEERWNDLSAAKTQQIENNWQCTGFEDCKNVAISKARKYETLTLTVAIAIMTYQLLMIVASYFYIQGLNRKQYRITAFSHKPDAELEVKKDNKEQRKNSQKK